MVKQAKKSKGPNRLLPIIGLVLGITFGLLAFVLTPTAKAFLVQQRVSFGGAAAATVDFLIWLVLWLVMFGIAMFIVALAVGTHEDDKTAMEFYKRAAKRKERQKYEQEMKRRRQMELRKRAREEAQSRRDS